MLLSIITPSNLAWSTCSIYLPPIWTLSAKLVRVLHFCRVIISRDLVLDVLSDIRLLSAQVDTVLATSFN